VSCHADTWRHTDASLDPNSRGAEPSWQAAAHSPGCEAKGISAVIRTEQRESGAGWRTTCLSCGWISIYFGSRTGRMPRAGR
jgi:hypothetical protein